MIGWLIERRLTVALIVLATSVMGIMAYEQLPREAFPDVEIPFVMVSTPYPGVSPADVESLLTIPLENQLAAVDDLVEMSSMSSEGMSVITLELAPEASTEEALQQVRDRVSRARAEMPEDVEETDVREIAISDMPVLLVTLGGGGDEIALKRLGERLEDDIERLGGVMSATLSGGREREIRVQVNPDRLAHYELGLNDVIGAIADENVNIPGGDIRTGDANFLLRVPGEFEEPAEIEGVAVKRVGD
ncbi:MAG: efflux RND transporter permease subunit, partial [Myxococcales bacterium]|nr:efflux RND transporter permease subunit [Myxococcales bacterium]